MAQLKQIFKEAHTYATRDNAQKALTKAALKVDGGALLHYVIAVAEDGRFFPVVLPSADQVQIACDLAINFNIASARV